MTPKQLLAQIGPAEKAVMRKSPMRQLECLRFAPGKVTGSDLTLEVTAPCGLDLDTLLNGAHLHQALQSMPPESELRVDLDNGRAILRAGRSRHVVPALNPADYPSMPFQADDSEAFELDVAQLRRVLPAVDENAAQPMLSGVHVFAHQGQLRIEAARHSGMLRYKCDSEGRADLLLPRATVQRLADGRATVRMGSTNNLEFQIGEQRVISTRLGAQFPPSIDRVIPPAKPVCTVNRAELTAAIRSAAVSSMGSKIPYVVLHLRPGQIEVTSSYEQAESSSMVDANTNVTESVPFHAALLLDCLDAFEGDEVELSERSGLQGLRLDAVGHDDFLAVAMPMKI
jgi:DNA polymerase-3 subunit beta